MSRFLRWQYLSLRLAALIVLALAVQFGLARFIEWKVIRAGQRSVGAKVELTRTHVSLLGSQVTFRNLCVANSESAMRNLLEADRCEFELEPNTLLHKQAVIRNGEIVGLRFGTPRDSSGALAGTKPASAAPLADWLDEQSTAAVRQWLDRLHDRFQGDLVDQLESIRLVDDLLQKWPKQYDALRERVEHVKQQTADLHTQVRRAQSNPLRHVDFLNAVPDEIARLHADVATISRDVERLPSIAETDRRAIVAARQHDEKILQEELQFEKIDANLLTAYLMREQLAGPMADVVGWLRWIRQIVPAEAKPVADSRRRGHDVLFAGCQRTPDLLIRSLEVRGTARIGSQPLELMGQLTNVSNKPELQSQPMRLRLTTSGSLPLELQATIDRTGPVAKDQLLVDCHGIVLPKLRLGGSDKLRLHVLPTTASLNVSIMLEGNRLSGDIQLVQKQVEITPSVGRELEQVRLDAALEDSLGDVKSLSTRISLSGTLDEPRWQLSSNIGPAVAEAVDRALTRTANVYARRVLAQSQQRVDERLAQLDRQIAEEQAGLTAQLTVSTDAIQQLEDDGGTGDRLSSEQVGQRLPDDSLFQ